MNILVTQDLDYSYENINMEPLMEWYMYLYFNLSHGSVSKHLFDEFSQGAILCRFYMHIHIHAFENNLFNMNNT